MTENKHVDIISNNGRIINGEFALWEEAPENQDQVRLDLHIANEVITAVADTFFDALADIRRRLADRGLRPKCFGACRDVYPSPMIRSMGSGQKAYRLRLGSQAKMEDLVQIFDTDPEITPASVDEQEEFYGKWLKSLK
jgi:hypothetical protein